MPSDLLRMVGSGVSTVELSIMMVLADSESTPAAKRHSVPKQSAPIPKSRYLTNVNYLNRNS